MAVQLSLTINDLGYDNEANTSTATVTLIATYSGGSYNKNASGTLYINGVSYPFTASVNAQQQDHGTETIYSQTVVIDRSVTNTVNCSATLNVGGSTGTASTSGSMALTGSPSGGGDSGGGEGETEYRYAVTATVSPGAVVKISVPAYEGGFVLHEMTESGEYSTGWIGYDSIIITADVLRPDMHKLDKFVRVFSGTEYPITRYTLDGLTSGNIARATVIAEASLKAAVYIDNGEALSPYTVHIDNGTGWDMYAPYVDNGTGWDLCS